MPNTSKELHSVYLTKGVRGTTAIEGNTLSEEQVRQRIEGRAKLPPSQEYLGKEIDNIVEACNKIKDTFMEKGEIPFHPTAICIYNKAVLDGLPLKEGVVRGRIRTDSVGVPVEGGGYYRGAPAQDCEYLLSRLCEWLGGLKSPEGQEVIYGILKAIWAHLYIAWIHPFGDGNGRTARLIEFHLLLSVGIPTPAAHLLSNHYNQTRSEYYRHLDLSSKHHNGVILFTGYALQGLVDQLKDQLEFIQGQQLIVHWVNYIHDCFKNKDRGTDRRRLHLVLDLSQKGFSPTPISELRTLSPRMSEYYATKTGRTINRDVRELDEMGLVEVTEKGVRARIRETMLVFLPQSFKPPQS